MSDTTLLRLVAYNGETYVWQDRAVPANSVNRAAAIAWINSLSPTGGHELLEAGVTSVGIASATYGRQQLLFLGHRFPSHPTSCLMQITSANYRNYRLNVVYVPVWVTGQDWWQSLAEVNGGLFRVIE